MWIPPSFGSGSRSSVFSGVFITKEVDEAGDKGSAGTTAVDADTNGGIFEHVPEICLFYSFL
jgi:hypothetical protein